MTLFAHKPLGRLTLTSALLFASLTATERAWGDGYNTWPGALVGWGDLEVSPQLEVQLPSHGETSLPLMLQAGLTPHVDLALNLGLDLRPSGASLQPMALIPRVGLGKNATAGVGLGWSLGHRGFSEPLAVAVLTWAWEPAGPWRGDTNIFATLPLEGGRAQVTVDALAHVERHLAGPVSLVFEVDAQVAALNTDPSANALALLGLFFHPKPCDCVTFAAGYTVIGDDAHPRGAVVGAWWNHVLDLGFGERACRRDRAPGPHSPVGAHHHAQ